MGVMLGLQIADKLWCIHSRANLGASTKRVLMKITKLKLSYLLICLSIMSINFLMVNSVKAACTNSSGDVLCSSGTSGSYTNPSGTSLVTLTNDAGSALTTLSNQGTVTGNNNSIVYSVGNKGTIDVLTNSGTITSTASYRPIQNDGSINQIVNSGTITMSLDYSHGIFNTATINTVINSGIITGPGYWTQGIHNYGGTITTVSNAGTISVTSTGNEFGIKQEDVGSNIASIVTLNNVQGAGNSAGALTYLGALPTNYNIMINSPTSFGRLAVTSGTGSTAFGIYTGSLVSNNTKYTAVLSGITSSQVTNKSGTYGGYSWALGLESGSADTWDLIFGALTSPVTGPSIANTNQSLVNTASALQGTYTLQNSVLANSFSYDCNTFGENNVCVSAGGRNTQVQAANGLNNTSALLIAAYRPHPNYRIGAYADQNLSVSNPGGTVNLGNNTPLIGLFAAWNERLDGTGTEVKVSAAYGQKNTTMTRSVVGSGTGASEAGSGSSTLNSQGTQLTAKYGFGILDNVIVSPYVGVRYTQNNMGGYTEGTSSTVTAPLTYSALNTNATTALAGVGASYRVIPQVMTFASAGVETDTNTANGTYSATNSSIGTLTPVNFNANPVRTRPTATVGAYYDIEKNQRIGITGIYRQEAYQAVSTTTVMATYTIGL